MKNEKKPRLELELHPVHGILQLTSKQATYVLTFSWHDDNLTVVIYGLLGQLAGIILEGDITTFFLNRQFRKSHRPSANLRQVRKM